MSDQAPAPLKSAYLFVGTDEIKIQQTRTRLAARAAAGGATLEVFSGDRCDPTAFAQALATPSLMPGDRIVLAEGIERWRADAIEPVLNELGRLAPGTTAVLVGRKKPLVAIVRAVEAAGGEQRELKPPEARELPKWLIAEAAKLGCGLTPDAARALIDLVGADQRRLITELEKLTIYAGPGTEVSETDVAAVACGDLAPKSFALADAVLDGDAAKAVALSEELLQSGERPAALLFALLRAFDQTHHASLLLARGRGGEAASELKLPPWLAQKVVARAGQHNREQLANSIIALAALDYSIKGGSELDDRTDFYRTLEVTLS